MYIYVCILKTEGRLDQLLFSTMGTKKHNFT